MTGGEFFEVPRGFSDGGESLEGFGVGGEDESIEETEDGSERGDEDGESENGFGVVKAGHLGFDGGDGFFHEVKHDWEEGFGHLADSSGGIREMSGGLLDLNGGLDFGLSGDCLSLGLNRGCLGLRRDLRGGLRLDGDLGCDLGLRSGVGDLRSGRGDGLSLRLWGLRLLWLHE